MKVSIGGTTLVFGDDLELLQAFEDELKHLLIRVRVGDERKRTPELINFRSITLRHSLCHIDCIKNEKRRRSGWLNASSTRSEGKVQRSRRRFFDHGLVTRLSAA